MNSSVNTIVWQSITTAHFSCLINTRVIDDWQFVFSLVRTVSAVVWMKPDWHHGWCLDGVQHGSNPSFCHTVKWSHNKSITLLRWTPPHSEYVPAPRLHQMCCYLSLPEPHDRTLATRIIFFKYLLSEVSRNDSCPDLPEIQNGWKTTSHIALVRGARITYQCDPGYDLVGRETLSCQLDLSWSSQPPFCEKSKSHTSGNISSVYVNVQPYVCIGHCSSFRGTFLVFAWNSDFSSRIWSLSIMFPISLRCLPLNGLLLNNVSSSVGSEPVSILELVLCYFSVKVLIHGQKNRFQQVQ